MSVSSQVEITRQELRAPVDTDHLRIAHFTANRVQRPQDILRSVLRTCVDRMRIARVGIEQREDPDLAAGAS